MRYATPRSTAAFALLFSSAFSLSLLAQNTPAELPSKPQSNGPQWIWSQGKATPEAFFEKEFLLSAPPISATLKVACDNGCKVIINGKTAAQNEDWNKPTTTDAKPILQAGINKVRVEAKNEGAKAVNIIVDEENKRLLAIPA